MDYVFTLKYQVPEHDDMDALVERLGAGGCDDALIGSGLPGRLALAFTREAESAELAMLSALRDVKTAIPGVRLVEAAPDLVGLSDIAAMVGVSRQNIRKLMLSHPDSFPLPEHEGSTSLWHLAQVLNWLHNKAGYSLDQAMVDIAEAAQQVNLAKVSGKLASVKPEWVAVLN